MTIPVTFTIMLDTVGYFGAVLMGLLQGLLGGGGSVLAVPIFVYIFHTSVSLATTYSLLSIGITSLIGGVSHIIRGNIRLKTRVSNFPKMSCYFFANFWI